MISQSNAVFHTKFIERIIRSWFNLSAGLLASVTNQSDSSHVNSLCRVSLVISGTASFLAPDGRLLFVTAAYCISIRFASNLELPVCIYPLPWKVPAVFSGRDRIKH